MDFYAACVVVIGSRVRQPEADYWRSNSPLPMRLRTVKPAFLASLMERGLSFCGELKLEMILRTGLRQRGHFSRGGRLTGRFNVNLPPQTLQSPSISSYS